MQSVHSFPPSVRSLRHPWAEVNCEIEVQSRVSGHPIQNLIILQHFDSFVVPSRRPIDGRGQKLDIELECPGLQINDSLRSPKREPGQNSLPAKAFGLGCRADKMTYCIPLSLSITHSRFLAMLKVHKIQYIPLKSTLGVSGGVNKGC